MSNLFQPGIADGFQKQLDDLQRSYAQLGKIQQPVQQTEKHEFKKVADLETAKSWAKENLAPGESCPLFDENKDVFYAVSKSQDGVVQPLLVCPYTTEPEPPKPEYATKQDFDSLRKEILELLRKEKTE
jgi:hypothetical protein